MNRRQGHQARAAGVAGRIAMLTTLMMAAAGLGVASASAEELYNPQLRGVNEGLGSLPPLPGVYPRLDNYFADYQLYDQHGNTEPVKLEALIAIPSVFWQTGLKIAGGRYSVLLEQPLDYTSLSLLAEPPASGGSHWGSYNTIFTQFLSWDVPRGLRIETGLSVFADDASSTPGHPPANRAVPAGNGFWSLEPRLYLTWLHKGWTLSARGYYNFAFEDGSTHYTSGQELTVDYTATKKLGNWVLGLGATSQTQFTSDTGAGARACATRNGCKVAAYGLGPVVSYQYRQLNIALTYNANLHTENDFGGSIVNLRLLAKF